MPGDEERRRYSDVVLGSLVEKMDKIISVQAEMHSKQAVIGSVVDNVLKQAEKTNGRVSKAEDEIDKCKEVVSIELKDVRQKHQDLKDDHNKLVNRAIGWSMGAAFIVALFFKVFGK